jgi:hypothetical protein
MKSTQMRKHCPDCPGQCFCGSTEQLEDNHLGGRKHVPWLWTPYCRVDHVQYHANCRRAGVDFGEQQNQLMAQIQAFKAQLVGMWMVVEAMEKQIKEQQEKK